MSQSPYTEKEIEEQQKVIKTTLWKVFMPILFATLIIGYIVTLFEKPIKIKIEKPKLNGSITYLSSDIDICSRCPNYIYINNKIPIKTDYSIFSHLELGDSISKNKNSDTIYYFKKSGRTIKSVYIP